MAEAKQPNFLDILINTLRDSFGQLGQDVSRGNVMNIVDQLTRGPTPLGKLPVRGAVQRFAPKANDLLSLVMNMAQPQVAKGIIAPVGNPRLKAAFEALREKAPNLIKQAEGKAETVFPYLMPRELMPGGESLGAFRQSMTLPKGELYVRGGRPAEETATTLAHELRHFLTGFDPELLAKPAGQMEETARQLAHMMPAPQQAGMQSYLKGVGMPSAAGTPQELLKQTQGGARTLGRSSATTDPELALNEAMSYLTEALLEPRGGDPMLEAVANALGQGIK